MALQFQGHRHLDDVIAKLEKRYGKAGGKTPQPSEAHFKKNQPPKRKLNLKILQPAKRQVSFQPPSVLDTGALPATVTTRRKPKPKLSVKEDRKRRMKKRHWYEDKFGDLSKFAKKKPRKKRSAPAKKKGRPKRAAAQRAMAKIKREKAWYARKFQVGKFAKPQGAPAKSRSKKKPICFNRRTTLLSLLKRIPAVKTPLAKLLG